MISHQRIDLTERRDRLVDYKSGGRGVGEVGFNMLEPIANIAQRLKYTGDAHRVRAPGLLGIMSRIRLH